MNDEVVIGHSIYGINPVWVMKRAEWLCDVRSGVDGQANIALALRRADSYRTLGYTDVVVYELVRRPVDAPRYAPGSSEDPREMQAKQEGEADD